MMSREKSEIREKRYVGENPRVKENRENWRNSRFDDIPEERKESRKVSAR